MKKLCILFPKLFVTAALIALAFFAYDYVNEKLKKDFKFQIASSIYLKDNFREYWKTQGDNYSHPFLEARYCPESRTCIEFFVKLPKPLSTDKLNALVVALKGDCVLVRNKETPDCVAEAARFQKLVVKIAIHEGVEHTYQIE